MEKRTLRYVWTYKLSSLFLLMAVVGVICAWPQLRLSYLCWRMSNYDISIRGIDIRCDGYAATIVQEFGLSARGKLKPLLVDPNRFAAAHAVLAEVTNVKRGGTIGRAPGEFIANMLHYHRSAEGSISINLSDNLHLHDWWVDYVGYHTGIEIIDEATGRSVWYDDLKATVE